MVLIDHAAHGVTATNSRTDKMRAAALGFACALGIVLLALLTISYVRNRALERDVATASRSLSVSTSASGIYARLDQLRRPVERLIAYRTDPPLSMRWGLYHGNDVLASAQAAYCQAFRSQVLPPVMQTIRGRLEGIPGGKGDHFAEFGNLKAYMMMTTHPQEGEGTFLANELMSVWAESPALAQNPDSTRLLPAEFRVYGALLSLPDARSYCVNQPMTGLIPASAGLSQNVQRQRSIQIPLAARGPGH